MSDRLNKNSSRAVWETALVLLLIAAGSLLRLLLLGSLPHGLNQDEASTGYEAWALLTSGVDRNGNSWPALFVSWGSGQNVLYSYLLIPVIAVFGLNEVTLRLPQALLGCASLPFMWLLVRKLRGRTAGLAALGILVLNPWHIMMSRWALESNILPFFLLFGLCLLVYSHEKPWLLSISAAAFGLSLYAYGTAFVYLFPFLTLSLIVLLRRHDIPLRHILVSGAVFVLIALPITVCNGLNILGLPEIKLFGVITLPLLTETRQAATTALGSGLGAYLDNFIGAVKILWDQSDGLIYNSIPGLMFAPLYLPLSLAGIAFSVADAIRRRLPRGESFLLLATASSLLAMFVITPNVNRLNFLLLPLIAYSALGLVRIVRFAARFGSRLPGRITAATAALLAVAGFAVFGVQYLGPVSDSLSVSYYDDFCSALDYSETLDTDTVTIVDPASFYIYVLFAQEIPPEEFYSTVVYENPGNAFQAVLSFSKYRFGDGFSEENTVYIVRRYQAEGYMVLAEFGDCLVCTR